MKVVWWKRLIYSLASVAAAVLICCSSISIWNAVHSPAQHLEREELVYFAAMVFLLSLSGWVLAIPIVLLVTGDRGWRFWMYWAIGTCIGPFLIYGLSFYFFIRSPTAAGFSMRGNVFVYLSAAISCLTTIIFLLLLRRAQAALKEKHISRDGLAGH